MKNLCRVEQRVGRLDVLAVPEAAKDCHELTQRLGVVQPVLRSISRHPHGEHGRPRAFWHLDVADVDRAHKHQSSFASLHGRR
eukprot:1301700-Pleurochrysis_carterae.AAC.1